MLFSDVAVLAWSWTLPKGHRVFHQLSVVIVRSQLPVLSLLRPHPHADLVLARSYLPQLTTASIAYFCLAANVGQYDALSNSTAFRCATPCYSPNHPPSLPSGNTPVIVEFARGARYDNTTTRAIAYVR